MGSAYAEFQENEKGSITPGKLADMVILGDDIFNIDPKLIRNVQVETTIMGGKVVWQRTRREAFNTENLQRRRRRREPPNQLPFLGY
jgi:adenine deaminase